MTIVSCLYLGEVGHRRLSPVHHQLRYRVYNLFADVDELASLGKRLRFFSYNRFNLLSISDRNHGSGDGTSIAEHAWKLARAAETQAPVARIFMFCYPRVLGYVFNPITVYYGLDAENRLQLMIYEVNNTFGERHSYVLPAGDSNRQSCSKKLYVSPFNNVEGKYDFRFSLPGEHLSLTIALSTVDGLLFKAWFAGNRAALCDRMLLRSFFSLPLQSLKITCAILVEAARLWLKGLRAKPRPRPPTEAFTAKSAGPRTP